MINVMSVKSVLAIVKCCNIKMWYCFSIRKSHYQGVNFFCNWSHCGSWFFLIIKCLKYTYLKIYTKKIFVYLIVYLQIDRTSSRRQIYLSFTLVIKPRNDINEVQIFLILLLFNYIILFTPQVYVKAVSL